MSHYALDAHVVKALSRKYAVVVDDIANDMHHMDAARLQQIRWVLVFFSQLETRHVVHRSLKHAIQRFFDAFRTSARIAYDDPPRHTWPIAQHKWFVDTYAPNFDDYVCEVASRVVTRSPPRIERQNNNVPRRVDVSD